MDRRSVRLGGVAALVLVVAACSSTAPPATGTSGPTSTASTTSKATSTSTSSPSGSTLVASTGIHAAGATLLDVPGGMDWITVAAGSAWTSSEAITRLDGRTGKVLATIALAGSTCLAPDVGFGSLWFGVCGTPEVLRIDPSSGKVLATITVTGATDLQEESSVAAGAGGVWVLAAPGRLVHVDPRTNRVEKVSAAPAGASAVRASSDALWVTVHGSSTLLKLDPRTLRTLATVAVGRGPQFLALGLGSAWTLDQDGGTVTRVDLATATAVATVRVDSGAIEGGDIAVGGGFVWARVTDGLVAKIDPGTTAVVARYGPALGSGSVAADDAATWITAHDSSAVFRLPSG